MRLSASFSGVILGSRRKCSDQHKNVCLWSLVLRDEFLSPLYPGSHAHTVNSVGGVGIAHICQYSYWQGWERRGCHPRTGLVADSMLDGQNWSTGNASLGEIPEMQRLLPLNDQSATNTSHCGYTFYEAFPRGPATQHTKKCGCVYTTTTFSDTISTTGKMSAQAAAASKLKQMVNTLNRTPRLKANIAQMRPMVSVVGEHRYGYIYMCVCVCVCFWCGGSLRVSVYRGWVVFRCDRGGWC